MKITKVILENGNSCGRGSCPAALLTDSDHIFIQGYVPEPTEGKELAAPAGEGFVKMPKSVFLKIAAQVLAS